MQSGEGHDGEQAHHRVEVELGHVPVVGHVENDSRRTRLVRVSEDPYVVKDEAGRAGDNASADADVEGPPLHIEKVLVEKGGHDRHIKVHLCQKFRRQKQVHRYVHQEHDIPCQMEATISGFIFVRTIFVQNRKCSPFLELTPTL